MGEQSLLFYEREIFLQKSITLWLPQGYKEQIAKQNKPNRTAGYTRRNLS